MRYDQSLHFHVSKRVYDPEAGEATTIVSTEVVPANVTDLGTDRAQTLFGDVNRQAKVVRFRQTPPANYSYITIGSSDTKYTVNTTRSVQQGFTWIVGESDG